MSAGDRDPRPENSDVAPTTHDVAEGVGGITGTAAGASMGIMLGPVGALVGAAAGALGGWWAGRAVANMASDLSDRDVAYYRDLHARSPHGRERTFDDVRDFYYFGHVAGGNPEYNERSFTEVEPELRRAWQDEQRDRFGEWDEVRDYVATGYERRPR